LQTCWTAFEGAHDVAGNLLRIGKACGVGQVIGHGSLDRSGLDGDDADADGMKAPPVTRKMWRTPQSASRPTM
jgi:hypothetical protein